MIVLVMGVAGTGKTTVGGRLARRLGWTFVDADDLHDDANRARMAAGQPLDDADRRSWLQAVRRRVVEAVDAGQDLVLGCSALKRTYRRTLFGGLAPPRVVFLHGDRATLESRIAGRPGHFFPPDLLQSQLDILEPPGPTALRLDVAAPPDALVERIVDWLGVNGRRADRSAPALRWPGQGPSIP